MNLSRRFASYMLATVVLCMLVTDASAIAFCALRDPVRAIHALFPEADNHHSIVRAIGPQVRDRVAKQLPFSLHFNELGKHTLYVATQNSAPVGFVHVRSELTEWGLMEIAWALNPDLSIRSLVFQRCRAPACSDQAAAELRNMLSDRSTAELLSLVSSNGESLSERLSIGPEVDKALALSAIRSALKTVTVTAIAWGDEVAETNRQLMLIEQYGDNAGHRLAPQTVDATAQGALAASLGTETSIIDRSSVRLFRVTNQGQDIGWVTSANWKNHKQEGSTHWLFDALGMVNSIRAAPRWPNPEISEAFDQLLGTSVASDEVCTGAAGLVGYELYFLASRSSD